MSELEKTDDDGAKNPLLPTGNGRTKRDRELEGLLDAAGYGFFHVVLVLVTGLATAADAVEIFGVSFIVPVAGKDLHLTTARKGYLNASIFVGKSSSSRASGGVLIIVGV